MGLRSSKSKTPAKSRVVAVSRRDPGAPASEAAARYTVKYNGEKVAALGRDDEVVYEEVRLRLPTQIPYHVLMRVMMEQD